MREHAELLDGWFDLDRGIRDFRKHAGWYTTTLGEAALFKRTFNQLTSAEQQLQSVQNYFESLMNKKETAI